MKERLPSLYCRPTGAPGGKTVSQKSKNYTLIKIFMQTKNEGGTPKNITPENINIKNKFNEIKSQIRAKIL